MHRVCYRFGEFVVDGGRRELLRGGREVGLTPKEFQTLLLLVEAGGQAVEREQLIRAVWPDSVVGDTSLGRNISVLRRHLGAEAIVSVARYGYRFTPKVERMAAGAAAGVAARSVERRRWMPGFVAAGAVVAVVVVAGAMVRVRETARRASRVVAASRATEPVRLAVLPFHNASAKAAETDYLRDGIADELTARLGELDLKHMQVLARSTTRQYADTAKPAAEIAAETGAQYLLEGSVRFDEGAASVTAYLVDGDTQAVVWSQVYQRPRDELYSVQEEIANRIAANPVFAGGERPAQADASETLPEAHDAYLRGRYELAQGRRNSYRRALAHFEQAVQLDPGYAKGYAGVAEAYIYATDGLPLTYCYAKSRDAVTVALQLDDRLGDAHRDLGWLQMYERNDAAGAEAELRRALELNPDDAKAHHWYSYVLSDEGRHQEAVQQAEIGYELDPRSSHSVANYGYQYVQAGNPQRGRQLLEQALKIDPEDRSAWGYLGTAYLEMGAYKEAAAAYDTAGATGAFDAGYLADAAYARALGGDPGDAQRLLKDLTQREERGQWFPAQAMALTEVAVGNKAEAKVWLRKAVEDHSITIYEGNHEPFRSAMKDQPDFPGLLKEAGGR